MTDKPKAVQDWFNDAARRHREVGDCIELQHETTPEVDKWYMDTYGKSVIDVGIARELTEAQRIFEASRARQNLDNTEVSWEEL